MPRLQLGEQSLWRQFRHCKTLEGLAINFARCFAALHRIFRRLPRSNTHTHTRTLGKEGEGEGEQVRGHLYVYIIFVGYYIIFALERVFCSHFALAAFGAAYFMQLPLGCCSCSGSDCQSLRPQCRPSRSSRSRAAGACNIFNGFSVLLIYFYHSLTWPLVMKIAQAARTFLNASPANCLTRPQRQGRGEGEGQGVRVQALTTCSTLTCKPVTC